MARPESPADKPKVTEPKQSEEMENTDIEDGEILEDESNSSEQTFQNKDQKQEEHLRDTKPEIKNNFEKYFHKEPKNHHNDAHQGSRRERYSDLHKKRKRIDHEDGYYSKRSKCDEDEDETDEDMIFVLGGSLKDTERNNKRSKKPILPDPPDDMLDPMMFNEGENEDPRPYSKRSPRRDSLKDRGPGRNVNVPLLRRRGRGGAIIRKNRLRDDLYFSQGKGQRNNDCNSFPHSFNHPRKLEICKFFLKDTCNKREKCIYMHEDFPCQYFHTSTSMCYAGKNCKFYHGKLDEVQRAVLKKYADIPLKEVDELQDRYYREISNNTYSSRNEKEKVKDANSRIPSLFDIKVAVPNEYRPPDDASNVDENPAEAQGQTPIPSPQSMMYDAAEIEEEAFAHTKHHEHKILSEHNDHHKRATSNEHTEFGEEEHRSSHKKRNKKSDDHSDDDKSRKHSEKRKKRTKEEKKSDKEKKKKKEHKRSKKEHTDLSPEPQVSFPNVVQPIEDVFEVTPEEHSHTIFDQKEPADALSHLPKKQQELFLRIQQHQKEAETSQSSNVDDDVQESDIKQDENWYSSDEEQEPEPPAETISPLATLLRTIQTSTSNAPETENKSSVISTQIESFITPLPASSMPTQKNELIPMVDPSQLANINLSDDITKILSSIINTDASNNNNAPTVSESLPSSVEKESSSLKGPFSEVPRVSNITSSSNAKTAEDVDLRFPPVNLMSSSLFSSMSGSSKDIDLRQLPFKPIPVHDAANEINASITSHPPIEYKLRPLPFISKVNYAALPEIARLCPNDPRFKRKVASATTTSTTPTTTSAPSDSPDAAHLMSNFGAGDPRFAMALKTMTDPARMDPRLNDPRMRAAVPRLLEPPAAFGGAMAIPPMNCDMKLPPDLRFDGCKDMRDPRLSSRNKFPDMMNPFPLGMPPNVLPLPPVVQEISMPPRKEDPRLRFRAAQNS